MKVQEPSITLKGAEISVRKCAAGLEDDEPVFEQLMKAAHAITDGSQRVYDTATKILANRMNTEIANKAAASDAAFKIFAASAKKIDSARAAGEERVARLELTMTPKAPANAVEALGHQEIRAALARLPEADRGKAVERAIAEGDDEFVAAALLGSPVLTGLGKAQRAALLQAWRRVRHGETLKRVKRLRDALDKLDRCGALFQAYALDLFGKDRDDIKAAEESAAAAKRAIESAAA